MKLEPSLIFNSPTWLVILVLLALMLLFVYAGIKVHGLRSGITKDKRDSRGAIMSAILALFGFLLAFTFGMSGSRFDARRENVVSEANAIGTAMLRSDLYPDTIRVAFRQDFRQYVEARIAYYESGQNFNDIQISLNVAGKAGQRIWDRAALLSPNLDLHVASMQMVPAVNQMLDMRTTRLVGDLSRVPDSVVYMLFTLALISAFFLGYAQAEIIDWMSAVFFCGLTVVIIFIILDLDRPRRGFIDLSTSHQAMLDLREMFVEPARP